MHSTVGISAVHGGEDVKRNAAHLSGATVLLLDGLGFFVLILLWLAQKETRRSGW